MRATLIVMTLTAMLLSACNGSPGDSSPRPTATFGPAVQTRLAEANRPRPTRTPTPESAAQAPTEPPATEAPAPTPRPTMTPKPDPADDLLLMALLAEDNMPVGWYEDEIYTYDNSDTNWSGDDDMLHSPGDDDFCGSTIDDPYQNQVAGVFVQEESDWVVIQFIALYASEQSADLYLSQLVAVLQHCTEYEEVIGEETELVTISQLEFPELGDRSAAFVIVATGDDYQVETVLAGFRIDRTVTLILQVGESAYSGPVETWGTQDIVVSSFEKIMSLKEQFDMLERPGPNIV